MTSAYMVNYIPRCLDDPGHAALPHSRATDWIRSTGILVSGLVGVFPRSSFNLRILMFHTLSRLSDQVAGTPKPSDQVPQMVYLPHTRHLFQYSLANGFKSRVSPSYHHMFDDFMRSKSHRTHNEIIQNTKPNLPMGRIICDVNKTYSNHSYHNLWTARFNVFHKYRSTFAYDNWILNEDIVDPNLQSPIPDRKVYVMFMVTPMVNALFEPVEGMLWQPKFHQDPRDPNLEVDEEHDDNEFEAFGDNEWPAPYYQEDENHARYTGHAHASAGSVAPVLPSGLRPSASPGPGHGTSVAPMETIIEEPDDGPAAAAKARHAKGKDKAVESDSDSSDDDEAPEPPKPKPLVPLREPIVLGMEGPMQMGILPTIRFWFTGMKYHKYT